METKIQRWGNSLGLRIPKSFAEEVDVRAGSTVELSVQDGELVARPVPRKRDDLKALLKKVTAKNIHEATETGPPMGREIW